MGGTERDDIDHLLFGLKRAGVADPRVLSAMAEVPRPKFMPASQRGRGWEDTALPIACGQTISQPLVVGLMTQALEVGPDMKVLEIGTGSGYQAAVLARLAHEVYTVERHRKLLTEAEARFKDQNLTNIHTLCGDGILGWPGRAPFDRIIVTAGTAHMPNELVAQLKIGGIMVLPLGREGMQELVKVIRNEKGIETHPFLAVRFVPLVGGVPDE